MSDTTTIDPAEVRRTVLGATLMRLGRSLDSAAEAGRDLDVAARRLAPRLTDAERKRLDDAAQLIAHGRETFARADALLHGVATGTPLPSAGVAADTRGHYAFAGYAGGEQAEPGGTHDLGGEG